MQVLVRDNNVDQALRVPKKCRGQSKKGSLGQSCAEGVRTENVRDTGVYPEFGAVRVSPQILASATAK